MGGWMGINLIVPLHLYLFVFAARSLEAKGHGQWRAEGDEL